MTDRKKIVIENKGQYEKYFENMHSSDGPRDLRQIFEDDDKPLQSETSNLRYQPHCSKKQQHQQQQKQGHQQQQQPQKPDKPEPKCMSNMRSAAQRIKPENPVWSTVVAKVAFGFNGCDELGRVGVALSSNGAGAAKLVVYKSRSQVLTTLLLTKPGKMSGPWGSTSALIMRECYMQFYDDEKRFWSLRFELEKDESEFTDALDEIGYPVEKIPDDLEKVNPVSSDPPSLPRQPPSSALAVTSKDGDVCSTYKGDSDTTEEFILTYRPAVAAPTMKKKTHLKTKTQAKVHAKKKTLITTTTSTMSLAITTPTSSMAPSSKLEMYLDDQLKNRSNDAQMEKILQAMRCMTSSSSMPFRDPLDSAPSTPLNQPVAKNLESMLQAINRLTNHKTVPQQFEDTLDNKQASTDNEDLLIELEQKLLDCKKENRALMKNLKAKDQTLFELRAYTCELCEELVSQNNQLKIKNTSAMSGKLNNSNAAGATVSGSSASGCDNCEIYLVKIAELEHRLSVLQNIVQNYRAGAKSAIESAPK